MLPSRPRSSICSSTISLRRFWPATARRCKRSRPISRRSSTCSRTLKTPTGPETLGADARRCARSPTSCGRTRREGATPRSIPTSCPSARPRPRPRGSRHRRPQKGFGRCCSSPSPKSRRAPSPRGRSRLQSALLPRPRIWRRRRRLRLPPSCGMLPHPWDTTLLPSPIGAGTTSSGSPATVRSRARS